VNNSMTTLFVRWLLKVVRQGRDRAQVFIDRLQFVVRLLPKYGPRHALQNPPWMLLVLPVMHHIHEFMQS
jgi:hypothetical protein